VSGESAGGWGVPEGWRQGMRQAGGVVRGRLDRRHARDDRAPTGHHRRVSRSAPGLRKVFGCRPIPVPKNGGTQWRRPMITKGHMKPCRSVSLRSTSAAAAVPSESTASAGRSFQAGLRPPRPVANYSNYCGPRERCLPTIRCIGLDRDSSASHQASLEGTSDALNIAAHAGQHATCCPGSRLAMAVHMGVAARQKQQFS
jgi:hypothetical protein